MSCSVLLLLLLLLLLRLLLAYMSIGRKSFSFILFSNASKWAEGTQHKATNPFKNLWPEATFPAGTHPELWKKKRHARYSCNRAHSQFILNARTLPRNKKSNLTHSRATATSSNSKSYNNNNKNNNDNNAQHRNATVTCQIPWISYIQRPL